MIMNFQQFSNSLLPCYIFANRMKCFVYENLQQVYDLVEVKNRRVLVLCVCESESLRKLATVQETADYKF